MSGWNVEIQRNLQNFIKKFGFEKIDNFISKDRLVVMMMKLDRKN